MISADAARLAARVARLSWRSSRVFRPAVVEHYDPDTHRARVRLTEPASSGGRGPWAPVQEARGHRTTLTPGEAVMLFCPDGDLRQAVIQLGLYTDATKPGADGAEETSFERGAGRVSLRPERARVNFGGTEVELTESDARMTLGPAEVRLTGGEARMTLGGAQVRLTESEARLSLGGGSISIGAGGKVSIG